MLGGVVAGYDCQFSAAFHFAVVVVAHPADSADEGSSLDTRVGCSHVLPAPAAAAWAVQRWPGSFSSPESCRLTMKQLS